MTNEELFYIGMFYGFRLAEQTEEGRELKFKAHPGKEMAEANTAIDKGVDEFKELSAEQIQTEYEISREYVPALTQQDADDCIDKFDKIVDSIMDYRGDEPLLPTLLAVLNR